VNKIKMKQLAMLFLVFVGLLSLMPFTEARDESDMTVNFERTVNYKEKSQNNLLTIEGVTSLQVVRSSGMDGSRLFRRTDGYEERVIRKVIEWINTSNPVQVTTDFGLQRLPIVMKLKMSDGDVAVIEPAYNCIAASQTKTCTAVDGEIVFTRNKKRFRLISEELYDWLHVGWKNEIAGPSKEELLEETLYARYFSAIGKAFPEFISCPRINSIERIKGDTRRHVVHASALNYEGHHAPSFDKIIITLIDTPENGIKIINVIRQKNISEKESLKQCGW
jgi:hypothetical protein